MRPVDNAYDGASTVFTNQSLQTWHVRHQVSAGSDQNNHTVPDVVNCSAV